MSLDSDPDPEPRTKGEMRKLQILQAIERFFEEHQRPPSIQEIQEQTGLRSFNAITRQLKILHQEGRIHWSHSSPVVHLSNDDKC